MADELREIPLYSIRINPYQPRRYFDEQGLKELAESLKSVGIIHPPLVRPLSEEGEYELIAGERRLRAAKLAGFTTIPVLIRHLDTLNSAQAALLENVQRSDLNPIEIARALRQLLHDFQLTQEELGEKLGKKRSTIANYIRLLSLPQAIQTSVAQGMLSSGHAKIILSLEKNTDQLELYEAILKKNLTVRQSEHYAKRLQAKHIKTQASLPGFASCQLQEMRRQLETHFGTKVQIEEKENGGGRILIDYYNLDDFDRLLQLFQLEADAALP